MDPSKQDDDDIPKSKKVRRRSSLSLPHPNNSCQLTLDPNTVNRNLWLSEENRKVEWHKEKQPYPHHPQRFQSVPQVLCTEGLSGTRCYWEIEWSGDWVVIGVAYKGIDKLGWGLSSGLGCNVNSWTLNCSGCSYTAWHNHSDTEISAQHSPRIGVYLDYPAGTLSFYRVSPDNIMTLLHRFQTTFTEPLYPAFKLDQGSTVTICQLR
ncbi:tripartite motif-containing protein 16-like isoform X2 [Acipenser ruthenus]|uniref:tripartite motif-containing protein 16-like isoform X2 n=1 Tax=Acipenser ruthenus TaxID=7906 RepID=UPI00145A972F|nr:tripartite motif-containing protein 16-like isoform X2 [Acipenser ruthenus]